MTKIIVPTFIEFNACQLTIDNLENFKKFISQNSYDLKITYRDIQGKQVPLGLCFRWNPYGDDYPDNIDIYINQYFLYEENNANNWKVLDPEEISEDWYTHES